MSVSFLAASSQALNLGQNLNLLNNVPGATLSFWMKRNGLPTTGQFFRIFGISIGPPPGTAAQSRIIASLSDVGVIRNNVRILDADAGSQVIGTVVIPDQKWTHVAITADCTAGRGWIYINGVLDTTGLFGAGVTAGNTSATNAKCAAIGALPDLSGGFYNGLLDDCRLYKRSISPGEVATIYAAKGQDGIWNGCQLRFSMNERAPGSAVVLASDLSASRLSALPSNAPLYDSGITTPRMRNAHRSR